MTRKGAPWTEPRTAGNRSRTWYFEECQFRLVTLFRSTNHKRGPLNSLDCPHGAAFLAHGSLYVVGINCSGSTIKPLPSSSDWSSLRKMIAERFGDPNPTESEYEPGTAYKRIFLPLAGHGNLNSAIDTTARNHSFVALRLLLA